MDLNAVVADVESLEHLKTLKICQGTKSVLLNVQLQQLVLANERVFADLFDFIAVEHQLHQVTQVLQPLYFRYFVSCSRRKTPCVITESLHSTILIISENKSYWCLKDVHIPFARVNSTRQAKQVASNASNTRSTVRKTSVRLRPIVLINLSVTSRQWNCGFIWSEICRDCVHCVNGQ